MLVDKPMIAYTIEAAIDSGLFDRVIVSTDSIEYKYIAERYGAEVHIRNKELASDAATSFMVVKDILEKYHDYDYFFLLQPTSPFRNSEHIIQAAELFESSNYARFLVSVTESDKSADLIKPIESSLSLGHFDKDFSNYRRQNCKQYMPNGAIFCGYLADYLDKKHFFGSNSIAYIMTYEDSIDIDNIFDFNVAIMIQNKKNKSINLRNMIMRRIEEKREYFKSVSPITFMGHSIFDYWSIKVLGGKRINNLGISGINSQQYYELILNKGLISSVGEDVFLMIGSNDIVVEGWNVDYTIYWINKIIDKIHQINTQAKIYIFSIPPVLGRVDRDNRMIEHLNERLSQYINESKKAILITFDSSYYDPFGNLSYQYTNDGLHFNEAAYDQLEKNILSVFK